MDYEWDSQKAAANLAKHGVAFDAVAGFDWPGAFIFEDLRRAYGEQRFVALGMIGDRVHVCIYTPRGATLRIIGLRKANSREIAVFERESDA